MKFINYLYLVIICTSIFSITISRKLSVNKNKLRPKSLQKFRPTISRPSVKPNFSRPLSKSNYAQSTQMFRPSGISYSNLFKNIKERQNKNLLFNKKDLKNCLKNCNGSNCNNICGGGKKEKKKTSKINKNLVNNSKSPLISSINPLPKSNIASYGPLWNHYHYHSHYPFYPFYWYFADQFYMDYPYYYSYFLNYHPSIMQNFRGSLIFENQIIKPEDSGVTIFQDLRENANTLKSCKNGPKYKFSARTEDMKEFRIFIGDVNDFFNIECIYMMNAIISIGKIDYSEYLLKMYDHPSRSVSLLDYSDVIKINPFERSIYKPFEPKVGHVTKRIRNLNFKIRIDDMTLTDKNLVFFHSSSDSIQSSNEIINELSKYTESGNVLFILDNLNPESVRSYTKLSHVYSRVPLDRKIIYRKIHYLPHHPRLHNHH